MAKHTNTLITRQEAAARAGVSPRTIDNWRKDGLLTTYTRRASSRTARIMVDGDQLDSLIQPQPVAVDA